jgi:hypothetical protein
MYQFILSFKGKLIERKIESFRINDYLTDLTTFAASKIKEEGSSVFISMCLYSEEGEETVDVTPSLRKKFHEKLIPLAWDSLVSKMNTKVDF